MVSRREGTGAANEPSTRSDRAGKCRLESCVQPFREDSLIVVFHSSHACRRCQRRPRQNYVFPRQIGRRSGSGSRQRKDPRQADPCRGRRRHAAASRLRRKVDLASKTVLPGAIDSRARPAASMQFRATCPGHADHRRCSSAHIRERGEDHGRPKDHAIAGLHQRLRAAVSDARNSMARHPGIRSRSEPGRTPRSTRWRCR